MPKNILQDKVIFLTGGTGSFGHKAVDMFLDGGVSKVIVYSRDEYKQSLMKDTLRNRGNVQFVIGDVRDEVRLERSMHGVDYVVHAAAMKQIPACEDNPEEAIATNVIGTGNVIRAAVRQGVECLVNLSADKAVYSVSVYGSTKFLAERLVIDSNYQGNIRGVNLRYSNILDSRGGVFEVFAERLRGGGTATVFDSSMTRFFLTQEEIVRLCIFAFEHCRGGETLVKLASPIRIAELATAMRDVIGNGQVEVHDNTARVGEKLDAVLLAEEEKSLAKSYGEIIIISHLAKELALDDIQPITDQQVDMDSRRFITDAELEKLVKETL
tara:strand:+ start:7 stop:984 length:978 start_codon:yes stop_codon:yes gene_type:complete